MLLKINSKVLSCLCLLISIWNIKIILSGKKKDKNIGLSPIVKVKASFNNCYKCKSDSLAKRITDSSSAVPTEMTCNGFLYKEMPYSYKVYFEKSEEVLTLSKLNSYNTFLNGNMMFIATGYVTNGTCAGDYVYSAGFAMPDQQDGCNGNSGVSQQNLIWNTIQIIGVCNSVCYGRGVIDLRPGISNIGAVHH